MRKNFSCVITAILTVAILFGSSVPAMAATGTEQIQALLAREVIVTYNGNIQTFTDANGKQVRPIAYQGTTYLPVRAVSKMFDNDIQWLSNTNTVAIGDGNYTGDNYADITYDENTKNENIAVAMSYDLIVTYKGTVQSFFDVNGKQVYPIINNGTTYLPIRAISNMFGEKIEWIGSNNEVAIGTKPEQPTTPEPIPTSPAGAHESLDGKKFNGFTAVGDYEYAEFVTDYNGAEGFTGDTMVIEAPGIYADEGTGVRFEDYTEMVYINFRVHNFGKTAVTIHVYATGYQRYNLELKAGEVKDFHIKVAGSISVAFDIELNPKYNAQVAIGNLVAP